MAAGAGLLVGAVLGSAVTTALRSDDGGPPRLVASAGPPRQSLGEVVVPVDVTNAGSRTFVVQAVRATPDGLTSALVGEQVRVPAGEAREVLARLDRDCPAAPLEDGDVRLDLEVRAGDDLSAHRVGVPDAVASLLRIVLACADR